MNDNLRNKIENIDRRRFLRVAAGTTCLTWALSDARAGESNEIDPPRRHDPQAEYVDKDHLVVALMADPQLHMNPRSLDHVTTAMNDLAVCIAESFNPQHQDQPFVVPVRLPGLDVLGLHRAVSSEVDP